MPTDRRTFIKQAFGAVSIGAFMPRLWLGEARGQGSPDARRRILVIIELAGGNDGLNTVIPFTNSRYLSQRPTLGFKEADLKDAAGRSTIISDQFALHPSLGKLKELYDAGKVAAVLGVGYPSPNLSHFVSADIWHTTNVENGRGEGWLGRYAEQAYAGRSGLNAAAITRPLPRTLFSNHVVVPSITNFATYGLQTDAKYPANRDRKIQAFMDVHNRSLAAESFLGGATNIGRDAVLGAFQINQAINNYRSNVTYPANNPMATVLRMLAQLIVTIPEVSLLYAVLGGFDTHARQIDNQNDRLTGFHASLLGFFSDGVKAFYDDMAEHGLADQTLVMQWSEFGRRPEENNSVGTDHGTASTMFVIGDAVRGGLYGEQPSLAAADLDTAGNMKFKVDFRSVYATVLDGWLGADSKSVLGAQFENVGFFG
jgi:uncharacterized protein (DUF1501 family)